METIIARSKEIQSGTKDDVMGATILPVLLRLSRIPHGFRRGVLLSSYSTIPSVQKSRDYEVTMNRNDDTIMR